MLSTDEKLAPRLKRPRDLILQSFTEPLGQQGFESISVQDVTGEAQINCATFYAHFL